jgi:hypothetical protein
MSLTPLRDTAHAGSDPLDDGDVADSLKVGFLGSGRGGDAGPSPLGYIVFFSR